MESKGKNIPKLRFPGFEGEWEVKKLGDSFSHRVEKNRDDLPLLSLGENGIIPQSETSRKDNSNPDKSKYIRVAVGDIAYNTMRMWQGRCVCSDIEGIVSPAYTVCKPKENINTLFHYYLFKTDNMIKNFRANSQGLVNDTLNLKFEAFKEIPYLLPTLPEQEKIASCLSSVDDMIAGSQKRLEALKEHKRGLMQQLFPQEGETVPRLRFPGFEGDWEVKKLGEIATFINGRAFKQEELLSEGKYKVLRVGNFFSNDSWYYSDLELEDKYYCSKGDLLYAWSCTYGAYFWNQPKTIFHYHIWKVICSSKLDKNFAFHLLNYRTNSFKNKMQGGTMSFITKGFMEDMKCFIPTLPEQEKIASCLTAIDKLIAAQQERIEALKQHKRGLMQQLFPTVTNE